MLDKPFVLFACVLFACNVSLAQETEQWSSWRGPLGTGEAPGATPPTSWNETENIKWKADLPGRGHSTPAIWGDRIFLTTAIPVGEKFEPRADNRPGSHDNLKVEQAHQFDVLCISRSNGKILWQTKVNELIPREGAHNTASLASASPVIDGKHVYAHFGSFGLYCLDFNGTVIWKKDFGQMHSKHGHGEGASPALFGDTIVINWDHEGDSFVIALDKSTGQEKWRNERTEVTSWASPIIYEHNGTAQAIVAGTNRVRGYDLETGKVIWECGGLSHNVVATPIAYDGMVYVGSSYESRAMMGIDLNGAKGDITGTDKIVWTRNQRTPYVPSPLLYDGKLYFLRHYQGILTQIDAKTGEEAIGPFRLPRYFNDIYASPLAADDKIYIVDRSGLTLVLSHSEIPKVVSINPLKDEFNASPVALGNELFLRGTKSLYCIEASPRKD